ncbi:MAG: hypothetical protein R2736_18530 [Solirubrobacterales bacterium]
MTAAAFRRPAAGIAAVLAALALVAVLAGCGSDDKVKQANAYVEQVNEAQTAFAQTIQRINRQVTTDSTATEDRKTLHQYIAAVDRVVKRLRAIDPPESVAPLHDKLVKAIDDYGDEVESAVNTLEHPTATSLLDAQQKLLDSTQTVTKQINSTIDRINTRLRS